MSNRFKFLVLSVSILIAAFAIAGGLNVHASADKSDGAYKEIGVYSEVLSRIRSEYVEDPNLPKVTSGALHGLLESLDPNSSYLDPQEFKAYKDRKINAKGDIGATVSKRFGYAYIVSVVPNSPADKLGIEDGDIIEAIGTKTTREMSLEAIRNLLAGAPGSNVDLAVVRSRRAEPQKFVITRAAISLPAVSEKMLEGGIGYVRVEALNSGKAQEIASRIKELEHQGAKKLILDVRDCSEGLASEGIATANLFLDHGEITYLTGQKFARQDFNAAAQKAVTKLPLVVLVNAGTAGAAEIVASAVLDNARGDVLGEKTFGDDSVQKLIEIPDGAALVLSVAKYYTPAGKPIQDNSAPCTSCGVMPNIEVTAAPVDETDDNIQTQEQRYASQPDEQLQRAIQVLKNKAS